MTMDPSLKVKAGAIRTRNVMTRAERIARLKELDEAARLRYSARTTGPRDEGPRRQEGHLRKGVCQRNGASKDRPDLRELFATRRDTAWSRTVRRGCSQS